MDRKSLRKFLGFAYSYRCFIQNYSSVASPLHALTSPQGRFTKSLEAEAAFQRLKGAFTTAPIFVQPGPHSQFVTEVDPLDVRIGTFLSQRSSKHDKLHPCCPLRKETMMWGIKSCWRSRCLWRSGRTGYLVWMDHKNLWALSSNVQVPPSPFPALEKEVAVLSAHAFICHCRRVWKQARLLFLHSSAQYVARANC